MFDSLMERHTHTGQQLQGKNVQASIFEIEAYAYWLKKRPVEVITLSEASRQLLCNLPVELSRLRVNPDSPGTEGLMFELAWDTLVYIVPVEKDGTSVKTCHWFYESDGWSVISDGLAPEGPTLMKEYNTTDRVPQAFIKVQDGVFYPFKDNIRIAINALAAYHADPTIIPGRRKQPKRKKGRARNLLRDLKHYKLSEEGTQLVTRRWTAEPAPDDAEPSDVEPNDAESAPPSERRSVGYHTVSQHLFTAWVKKPRDGEDVLDRKEGSKSILHAVRRPRGPKEGYSRGTGLSVRSTKMVTGPDD